MRNRIEIRPVKPDELQDAISDANCIVFGVAGMARCMAQAAHDEFIKLEPCELELLADVADTAGDILARVYETMNETARDRANLA